MPNTEDTWSSTLVLSINIIEKTKSLPLGIWVANMDPANFWAISTYSKLYLKNSNLSIFEMVATCEYRLIMGANDQALG